MTREIFKSKVAQLSVPILDAVKGGTVGGSGGAHTSTTDSDDDDK